MIRTMSGIQYKSSYPLSASVYWNQHWTTDGGRSDWIIPEADVVKIISLLKQHDGQNVLDLGCGIGRHAIFLAQKGFNVIAADMSPNGIIYARKLANESGVTIDWLLSDMTVLPYADSVFDFVLAWNVIYHGNLEAMAKTITEIYRILRLKGIFQATALSKRNANFRVGLEVATDTWIKDGDDDKRHPHCYLNEKELMNVLVDSGFKLLSLRNVMHSKPGSYHWHLVAQKVKNNF